jgi:hypothetical protein
MRDCGVWNSGAYYYNDKATSAMNSSEYIKYQNYNNMYVVDYVVWQGVTYLAKTNHSNVQPPNSSYWETSSKVTALTVNNLLANNAKLGEFNFSGNTFTSSTGTLSLNSYNGELWCSSAHINGVIHATSGSFTGTVNATSGTFNDITV